LLSAPNVLAQLPCTADFDCDQDVDATDVNEFLNQFGRSQYNDPGTDSCHVANNINVVRQFDDRTR